MTEIERKAVRLPQAYYLGFRSYFVTICAKDRKKVFTTSEIVDNLRRVLQDQSTRFQFEVHSYCFMPDHCHLLVAGRTSEANLSKMIRGFKGCSARELRRFGVFDAWQKGFYEHILRSNEDCASASAYVFENPVRAGLANDMYAWPFSGSFVFEWREFRPPLERFVPPNKVAEMREGVNNGEDNPR
ncbi:MAG TPA: transposase [Terriglobales bacterium]|nr:transposase [Terriglobales bacterium]